MANGILNVLSNVRKLSGGLFDGTKVIVDPTTMKPINLEFEKSILKVLTMKAKPFIVDSDFLDLVDSLTTPKALIDKINKSETGVVEVTDLEFDKVLDKMSAVSHLYRLPYRDCWIEKDKPWATVSESLKGVIAYKGVYLREMVDTDGNIGIGACVFGYDSGDALGKMLVYPSVLVTFMPHLLLSDNKRDAVRFDIISENQSWSHVDVGFVFKALGVILALNSPKIVQTTTEKMITKLANTNGNKKHVASDVVRVSVSKELRKQLNADKDLENEATRTGMRAHYVRGHFKVTRTGMFWWNAHIRGIGQASEKTYSLTP